MVYETNIKKKILNILNLIKLYTEFLHDTVTKRTSLQVQTGFVVTIYYIHIFLHINYKSTKCNN